MPYQTEKSLFNKRREQLIYWSSIGLDMVIPRPDSGVYVLGYVKSGTNWLCHLLSAVLDKPILEPWKLQRPMIKPCVYHMHRFIPLNSVRQRTVYLMRDGRDTMVSKYFHIIREGGPLTAKFEQQIGKPLRAEDIGENMAEFIPFMRENRIATIDYRSHLEEWMKHSDKYIVLRYEDLLVNPESELRRVVDQLPYQHVTQERIRSAVAMHDFRNLTKRDRGEEELTSFIRKGVSGDWRNYFTVEAAKVFDEYAGDLLLEIGYETERDWWMKPSNVPSY